MKIRNNVSKLELKNSLLDTVKRNDDGIEYIEERIFKSENILKLNPEDNYIKEQLKVEKLDLGQVFRHIFLRIFIIFSSFA